MKKTIIGILLFCLLLSVQSVFADGTCGTNVKYAVSGNTIEFSREDPASPAEWDFTCGGVFREDASITIVNIKDTISVYDA